MSKSYKDKIKKKAELYGWDSLSKEEQHCYPGYGGKKFKPDLGQGTGITPLGKLVAKNANRTVVKKVRQKAKKEIIEELLD